MAVQKRFTLSATLAGSPPSIFSNAKMGVLQRFSFDRVYTREDSDLVTLNATDASPYVVNQSAVPAARIFALKVHTQGASVKVKVTSAIGTDQTFNVSGTMLWDSPIATDALTAIKLVGVADVEYLIAGN